MCFASLPSHSPELLYDALFARLALSSAGQQSAAEEEVAFVRAALRLPPGIRVVDLPCGVGRHAELLARAGFEVTAVDNSEHCLELARERCAHPRITYVRADIRALDDVGGGYEALLSLYSCLGYFADEAVDDRVFHTLIGLLSENGRFVISTANRLWVAREAEREWTFEEGGYCVHRRDHMDVSSNNLTTEHVVRSTTDEAVHTYVQRRRLYSMTEARARLERAGARVLGAFGNWRAETFSDFDSPHMILVGERA